ncbi:hypothetical protein BDR07DRAFT_1493775 [Suillus spraguei]|nr:hypothetical protein BDR07DRAFT_1493775 [Suillus spraguei]
MPLSSVFPGRLSDHEEEATVDDHNDIETPIEQAWPRPLSEQLLERSRPEAMYEDENGA